MAGYKIWENLEVLTAEDLMEYLMNQAVPRFADATERDAALGVPAAGMLCYVGGVGVQLFSTGSWSTVLPVTLVSLGLDLVDNTADADKPISTATQTALDLKAPLASPTFTGTVSGITAAMVGLGNVDNTSDAAKPVSTAQAAADALKAPIASPTFTGTVSGITAAMVGLGNVDNTADAAKPVSTAQAAADALKLSLTGGTMSGVIVITKTAGSALTARATGDAQARLVIGTDGKLTFGDGTSAGDTNLYRVAADLLKTDDAMQISPNLSGVFALTVQNQHASGHGLSLSTPTATNFGFGSTVVGDSYYRYIVDCAGKIQWGAGATAVDTNLYRSAADTLKTDDALCIGGNVGFYGSTPAAKPTVTGSRGGNAAVASMLTALAGLGLLTDSSSA